MKKMILLISLLLMLTILTGCAALSIAPVNGIIYTNVNAPHQYVDKPANLNELKKGESTCVSYFGLIATGDASIKTAMENGNIEDVHFIDYNSGNFLGIVATYTIIVYGK